MCSFYINNQASRPLLEEHKENSPSLTPPYINISQPSTQVNFGKAPSLSENELKKISKIFSIKIAPLETLEKRCFEAALKACEEKNWKLINPNKNTIAKLINTLGQTLLISALTTYNYPLAQELINQKLGVSFCDIEGNTPLHIITSQQNLSLLGKLLECGIPIDARNKKKKTPLHNACDTGSIDNVKALLLNGASSQAKANYILGHYNLELNPLQITTIRGHQDCFDALTEENPSSLQDYLSPIGNLIHLAIHFNQIDLLSHILIKYPTSSQSLLKKINDKGQSPFMLAAYTGNGPALALLKTKNIPLDQTNSRKETALHFAVLGNSPLAIKLLCFWGADFNASNCCGQSAIDLAKKIKDKTLYEFMKQPENIKDLLLNEAAIINRQGSCKYVEGKGKEATELYKKALAIHEVLEDHPNVAASLNNVGRGLGQLGDLRRALEHFRKALEMQKRIHENKDHPNVAASLNNVGHGLDQLGDFKRALEHFRKALEMQKRIHENKDHPNVAIFLNNIGRGLFQLSDLEGALDYYRKAFKMRKRIHGNKDHSSLAGSLNNIGRGLFQLSDLEGALKHFREALEMLKRIHENKDHPDVVISLNNVGGGLFQLRDFKGAFKHFREALEMQKRIHGNKDHPNVAICLNNVGSVLGQLGDFEGALKHFREALEIQKRIHKNKDHPSVAVSLKNVGWGLGQLGNFEDALKHFREALEMRKRIHKNKGHPNVAASVNSVGRGLDQLGDLKGALKHYRQATIMAFCIYKKEHADISLYLKNLISVLNRTDDKKLIQEVKNEILRFCNQILGKNHDLTKKLLSCKAPGQCLIM